MLNITKAKGNEKGSKLANNYYPFGLTFNSFQRLTSDKNDFKYNGKEVQDALDIGWYDYGARMYMADIGRWNGIDLLIERHYDYTPYAYVYNNPVTYTDQFGLDTLLVNSKGEFADNKIKGGENDVVMIVKNSTIKKANKGKDIHNKDGKIKGVKATSKGFEKESIDYRTQSEGTTVQTSNKQSKELFNFLADNTGVEFSRIETSKNGITTNYITTSHHYDRDENGSNLTSNLALNPAATLISHTHSHPDPLNHKPIPSKGNENGYGDIPAYQTWTKDEGSTIRFFIRHNGVTREFKAEGSPVNSQQ